MVAKQTSNRSLAVSTIIQMGLRITLVVIAVTLLSYWHIITTLEEQTADKLSKYIVERAQKESATFLLAKDNHQTLKEVFLQAWPAARHSIHSDFERYFETLPDGSTRTLPRLFYGEQGVDGIISDSVSGFIGRGAPTEDASFRSRLVLAYRMLDRYGITYTHRFANLYIHMPENVNIVYWPGLPWGLQAAADLDMRLEEWMYIADRQHNPGRETIWTGLYYDPTADEWMVSSETPVDVDGQHLITLGHDVLLNDLFDRVFNDRLDGAHNFIIRDDGRLIAHPDKEQELAQALGVLSISEIDDASLSAMYHQIKTALTIDDNTHIINDKTNNAFLAVSRIQGPDWLFVTVFPKSLLASSARSTAEFILVLSIISLILELLMLYLVLRKKVITPIKTFVTASERIGQGDYNLMEANSTPLPVKRNDEMGLMARTFTQMATDIRHYQQDLEGQVVQRTEQLAVATKEANRANRAKSDFLARMSHEIRTPMNAIIGMTQLALRTELTDKQRDYLEKVRGSANALLGIINDILDFSKIEAGKLTLENIRFDLDEVFNSLSDIITLRTEAKSIELVFDIQCDVPRTLMGDPLRLGQILINLASNAVKFTEQGEIVVRVSRGQNLGDRVELQFSVIDSGIGMTPEQTSGLFQSFAQADESITRKYGGTGLGLAICKQLSELMGGRIWAESEAGIGSRFHFTVQLGVPAESRAATAEHQPLFVSKRVLVADDNHSVREILTAMLTRMGWRVDQVENGAKAVERLWEASQVNDSYDLLLTDWRMPEMDGLQVADWIKRQDALQRMPSILMVTGYGREEVFKAAREAGLDGFLLKPVNESLLQDTLAEIFGVDRRTGMRDAQGRQGPSDEELASLAGCRVLLVEDNAINLQIAREFLADVKAVVDVANNGQQAVDKMMSNTYDVVLMDIQMPIMDGLTATAKIRQEARFADLPIIAMTAQAMEEDRQRSVEAGMNDHLSKPLFAEELHAMLLRWGRPDKQQPAPKLTAAPLAGDTPPTGIPDLPGIDTEQAMSRLGGRVEMYLRLLGDFHREYKDIAPRLEAELAAGNWAEVCLSAHSIKSAARYLGANALGTAAEQLEQLTRDQNANQNAAADSALAAFTEALADVLTSLKALPIRPISEQQAEALSPAELEAHLDGLQAALEADSAKAETLISRIAPAIAEMGLGTIAEHIQELIADVEYEDALVQLQELRQQWAKQENGVVP
ncbi:hybrid sensor histidine kinase/response regulator [Nitrincola sp. MINF-07-Sa-05]|uniref:hybrid sensor histidine kinase/response regulator n=1 Tax=Nitrincola salilacus TaxID=3400273 RepID=UPI003917F5F4